MKLIKMLLTWVFRFQFTGLDKLKFNGPSVIIANHVSLLEAVFFALYLPKDVLFVSNPRMAKKFSFLMRFRKHITVDPLNPYAVRHMIKIVNKGIPLVIFPEGTRTATGGLMKMYPGVGFIALRTGANIYPIAINGFEFTKLTYIKHLFRSSYFPKLSAYVGDAFRLQPVNGQSMRKQKELASHRIYRSLQHTLLQSRLKPEINLFNEAMAASKRHGKTKVICEDPSSSLNYRDLLLNAQVLSESFKEKIGSESRVGVLLPTSSAHMVTLFALYRLDVTPCLFNFSLGKDMIKSFELIANTRTIITSRQFLDQGKMWHLIVDSSSQIIFLEDVKKELTWKHKFKGLFHSYFHTKAPVQTNEVILYTSGSEGKPKGVVLTHSQLYANMLQAVLTIDLTPKDRFFNFLPMFHSFGFNVGAMIPILFGVYTYLYPSPLHYKRIPELIYIKKATIIFGTSTFVSGYAKFANPFDFYSLRYVFVGGEKLRNDVYDLWFNKFGIRILEGYGLTESSPLLAINNLTYAKKGSVGMILPGIRYKLSPVDGIEEGGSLLVSGPNIMKGYLLHNHGFVPTPEWLDTGDVVTIDEFERVTIQSRLKRFAKIGGEMIGLDRVESIAEHCYSSSLFAAINVPDSRKGEKIILYTSLPDASIDRLKAFLTEQGHSMLFCPSKLIFIDSLPMLGNGKIDYQTLKKRSS